jgi:hypothetical protein
MFVVTPRRAVIRCLFIAVLLAMVLRQLPADQAIKLSIDAGSHDRVNTPVRVELAVQEALKDMPTATIRDDEGHAIDGQLSPPALLAKFVKTTDGVPRELTFILPALKSGLSKTFTVTIAGQPSEPKSPVAFHWQDTKGDHDDLLFGDRPVLRYMYHALDESTKNARDATFKPYHHVFDPADGAQLLTKGPGGLWPHHHGVFYGFREVTYDGGKQCDIWHCPAAFQEHAKFLGEEAGPVLGRQLVEINWYGEPKLAKGAKGDEPNDLFAKEKREITVYNVPGGTLIEFASRLNALMPPVHLDGDPQHSGFHFRASEDVHAHHIKETYYLRTDGKGPLTENGGKGEETRNWDSKDKDPRAVNLPWDAMSVVVGGKRCTIAYLDRKSNPKEARFSERDYGRLGSYFVADVTDKPLDVNYRLWIQNGEMTVDQAMALDADFDDPPKVTLQP